VLLVGDSLVAGLAPHFKKLAEAVGWDVTSEANIGKSTRWYGRQSTISSLVAQTKPHLVVIVLGTNDELEEHAPSVYLQQIGKVLQQTGRAKVVWVGPPTIPRSPEEDAGSAARNRIIAQQKVLLLDGRAMTHDLDAMRTPDGVHFTSQGSKIWAERIFTKVQPTMNVLAAPFAWKKLVVGASLAVAVLAGVWYWQRRT